MAQQDPGCLGLFMLLSSNSLLANGHCSFRDRATACKCLVSGSATQGCCHPGRRCFTDGMTSATTPDNGRSSVAPRASRRSFLVSCNELCEAHQERESAASQQKLGTARSRGWYHGSGLVLLVSSRHLCYRHHCLTSVKSVSLPWQMEDQISEGHLTQGEIAVPKASKLYTPPPPFCFIATVYIAKYQQSHMVECSSI